MARNEITLQSKKGTHPVDENLRPIQVGGKATSIETAQHGNGARVNGDLEVTGDIKGKFKILKLYYDGSYYTYITVASDGELEIATTGGSNSDITLDAAGNIKLEPARYLYVNKTGDTAVLSLDLLSKPLLVITSDDDNGANSFQLLVDDAGATTISTDDNDAAVAHLTLDVDGSIILDSHTGATVVKNAGTEFSVANSAYAGMILGYRTDGIDAADDSYTLTTSFAVTDANHKVKFVAPPSGVVEIFISIFADLSRRYVHLGLSDNATYNALDVTHEHEVYVPGGTADELQLNHYWVISGLTPNTAYEYWLGAKITAGAGGVLRWGGNVTGEWPPFIMKATALPTATINYATYG